MIIYLICSRLEFVSPYVEFFIMELELLIWKINFLCFEIKFKSMMFRHKVFNLFKAKTSEAKFRLFTEVNNAFIGTSYEESEKKYQTSVNHPAYDETGILVVEEYENEADAKAGHENWVKTFEEGLPNELKDVTNDKIYKRQFVDYYENYFDDEFDDYFDDDDFD